MRSTLRQPTSPILAALTICGLVATTPPAHGQTGFWGWGSATASPTGFAPDRFADYLITGQTPHPAVGRVVAPESGGTSLGSAVLVDVNRSQGLVLTNWHVVRDSRSAVLVQFPDGFQSAGTVVRWDEAWDLAAIVIWKPPATPVAVAVEPPRIGERLTIAGFGRGAYREETGECTEYLSPGGGLPREFVELRATARQGDSGGPIFNDRRELAGVLFGQNDGRTIGSCSTRLRAFLAAAGSRGFTPTPIAEFSTARAIDRGIGVAASQQVRLSDASGDGPLVRSHRVPAVDPVSEQSPPPLPRETREAVPPASQERLSPQTEAVVAELLDLETNGSAMLSAAGGAALVVLGVRTILASRRVAD